jgi:hypothetical protein
MKEVEVVCPLFSLVRDYCATTNTRRSLGSKTES